MFARHPIRRYSYVRLTACSLAIFAALAVMPSVQGSVVFNWPNSGWTAGQPGNNQTKTQSFTSISTNDISVSIFNSGVNNQGGYPAINSTETTSGLSGVNALQLYISSTPTFGNYLRVTVSFAYAVTNVSFSLWDCDASAGQFIDRFGSIQATAVGGGTVGLSSATSEVAGFNSITGTGLSTVIMGTAAASNTTNQGTVDLAFNQPITSFSFQWSNNDNGRGAQAVGLGPITYTVVPESSPALFGVASCAGAVLCEFFRRKKARRKQTIADIPSRISK